MEDAKKQIRKEIKEKEKTLTVPYKSYSDKKIFDFVTSLKEYQKARNIFCFISMPSEVNTHRIIEDAWQKEKRVCVPKCYEKGIMQAYFVDSWKDVKPGKYHILEPINTCVQVDPKDIDFALIPCCSATRDGKRLGFGGGFYDRYLPKTNCKKAVLCRDALLSENLPMGPYDQMMDIIISDNGVYYGS